jgi:hypothetical protein
MKIFSDIKNSIYGPEFYQNLSKQPTSFTVKYVLKFGLILALIMIINFSIFVLPGMMNKINWWAPKVVDLYPTGLEVMINDGEVVTNVEEPYIVAMADIFPEDERYSGQNTPTNLLVINTLEEPSLTALDSYDTLVLLSKNHVIYKEDADGAVTVQSLEGVDDVLITKEQVAEWVEMLLPYANIIIPFIFLGIIMFSYMVIGFHLVYLVLLALLVMLIGKYAYEKIGFGAAYRMSAHLMTLPLILTLLLPITIPFAFTLAFLALAALNFRDFRKPMEQPVESGGV